MGAGWVRGMIRAGATDAEIRARWQEDVARFRPSVPSTSFTKSDVPLTGRVPVRIRPVRDIPGRCPGR